MLAMAETATEQVTTTRDVILPPDDLKLEDWRSYDGRVVVLTVLSESGPDFEIHVVPFLSGAAELKSSGVDRVVVLDKNGESLQVVRKEEMADCERGAWEAHVWCILMQNDAVRESIESDRIGEFI